MSTIERVSLPYSKDAFGSFLSADQIDTHYEKHHNAYLVKLKGFIEADSSLKGKSLEEIVISTSGGVFNNAAQLYNHNFYWLTLNPTHGSRPAGKLAEAINKKWGNYEAFSKDFIAKSMGQFGSGWSWLVKTASGELEITTTGNADCPLTEKQVPLITCDLWEHAFYIDYKNEKNRYYQEFTDHINWDFAEKNFN